MSITAEAAPRVVVRPPNVPAPPPISLFTQGTVVESDGDLLDPANATRRWEGGGGSTWLEPVESTNATAVWQRWPDGANGGQDTSDKLTVASADAEGDASQSPIQRPLVAAMLLSQGALAEWALRQGFEGPVEGQLERAFRAVLPRVVESELWSSAGAEGAAWADQFRLKSAGHVTVPSTTALSVVRALAEADQAAADYGFIDAFGGAFIHCTPKFYALVTAIHHGLRIAPSGRQCMTPLGALLVPEPGASGTWTESGTVTGAKPGGAAAGNNGSSGWIFVTPPVRVRLSTLGVQSYRSSFEADNSFTILGEQGFVIEASVRSSSVSIGIPVDYTQEF